MQKVCVSLLVFCFVSLSWARVPGVDAGGAIAPPENPYQSTHEHHAGHQHHIHEKSVAFKTHLGHVEQPTLVVMVSFNDVQISSDLTLWYQRMFTDQFSVKNYFLENSNDQYKMVPAFDAGIISVQLAVNHPNFGSDYMYSARLASQALSAVGDQLNLHRYDLNQNGMLESRELAIVFVIAGYEQSFGGDNAQHPNIWAHQSGTNISSKTIKADKYVAFGEFHGSKQASIGLICHELGHLFFNLPDLYDRDGSSAGAGNWGVMSFGTWNSSGQQLGDRPANMLAWSKQRIGFLQLENISEQTYLAPGEAYKVPTGIEKEYFIIEYRQQNGFDEGLAGEGVLITHVDESVAGLNDNEGHKLLDVEEASGSQDLDDFANYGQASDLFASHEGLWNFDSQTWPNSDSYQKGPTSIALQFSPATQDGEVVVNFQKSINLSEDALQLGNIDWPVLILCFVISLLRVVYAGIRRRLQAHKTI